MATYLKISETYADNLKVKYKSGDSSGDNKDYMQAAALESLKDLKQGNSEMFGEGNKESDEAIHRRKQKQLEEEDEVKKRSAE